MVLLIVKMVFQVAVLTWFYYWFYMLFAANQAKDVVSGFVLYIVFFFLSRILGLSYLELIFKDLLLPFIVFMCIIYQPEIRRAFAPGFLRRKRFLRSGKTSTENIDSILSACQRLSQVKRGALIVFPRNVSIKNIIDTGTRLDAAISTSLIVTIFDHDTPLHDGAVIIQGSRIVAAGCYLPLSSQTGIKQSFGTRHRAALGMAEESDAAVIVVSEETKALSLAYNGNIYYQLTVPELKSALLALFNNMDINLRKDKGERE